ncbi:MULTISPECIES: hypothetical protein [Sphingobacterium]|uniref:hypothetical protein n=1 Tax=Sphingobacterium TaxID=28453 RepID=UPI0013DB821E|nr:MULTISPECIES: hypothetical protein [unclassified Sphingobacterium]
MNKLFSVLILATAIFSSCSSTSKIKEMKKETLSVEFVGNGTIKKAEGKVSLFAVSENIADVPATLILEQKLTSSKLPFKVTVELPENHKKMIKPAVREGEVIKYYVNIDWDSNNDGVAGAGDIVIDYDKKFPTVVIGETTQVFVHELK